MNWEEAWDRIDSADVNHYRPDRNGGESSDLGVIRESTDVELWPGFRRYRSFIIASRRLRDVQIGSGSTERRRAESRTDWYGHH